MNYRVLLPLFLGIVLGCGEAPLTQEDAEAEPLRTVTVSEQSLRWTQCLVGQTTEGNKCLNQPLRLALCNNTECTTSPANQACDALGPHWRLPSFKEYHGLRQRWDTYQTSFDFPHLKTAILTSTLNPDYPDWVVAYDIDPDAPAPDPQILFKKTTGAWIHCVSPLEE